MHLKNNQDPTLKNQVSHALEMPLQRRLQRLEARWYIEEQERGGGDVNPLLLEFAKLDFRMLQVTHRRDLGKLIRWWEGLGLAKELSFVRDRLVEAFYPTIGLVPEKQFGYSREGFTKLGTFITIIDDVYDVYGLLDELELFTDVVDRQLITVESLQHLDTSSDLIRLPSMIFPLRNDLATSKMWKKLNKMGCTPSPFPQTYIDVVFDLSRMSECFYHYGDGLGEPDAKLIYLQCYLKALDLLR
ncbi:hypothetical protein QJS10_CPA05g01885 [Acorus calamus]|uniref:Terpene synthase metal-binding domain-containing protein n=1 Tax=Acorus calamus TaxID=4465 RepID=A0AAV9EZ11_ACOCL|nr:hypothetical protein QJS10_CPA05g01885 [Acorus calamus]